MPTLRLLLALTLIALGTTGAAFAISGYFDPRPWPQEREGERDHERGCEIQARSGGA